MSCCETCKVFQLEQLQQAWDKRKALYLESAALRSVGNKHRNDGRRCHVQSKNILIEIRRLRTESTRFRHETKALRIKAKDLRVEGRKLYAKSNKLCEESSKLFAEGQLIFFNAVAKVYGNVSIQWNGLTCMIEGVEYK